MGGHATGGTQNKEAPRLALSGACGYQKYVWGEFFSMGSPESLAGSRTSRLPAPLQNAEEKQHHLLPVFGVIHSTGSGHLGCKAWLFNFVTV